MRRQRKCFADSFFIDHFCMCLRFVAGLTGLRDISYSHYSTKVPPMNVGCIRQLPLVIVHIDMQVYLRTKMCTSHLILMVLTKALS